MNPWRAWAGSLAGTPAPVGGGASLACSGAGRTAEDASRPRFRLWRTILHFRPHSLLALMSVSAEQESHSPCAACCVHTQWKLFAKAKPVGAPLRPFSFLGTLRHLGFLPDLPLSPLSPLGCEPLGRVPVATGVVTACVLQR